MKRTRQGNIRKEQERPLKVSKQAKNKVSQRVIGMQVDVSSLPKDVRIAIYKEMIEKS
jgi:hypothetical protein